MITQDELKKILHYDMSTGVFSWIKDGDNQFMKAGAEAGNVDSGYRRIRINRKSYKAHQLAWLYATGIFPLAIDHIDHNGLNNAFSNLREVNQAENMKNKGMYSNNVSGAAGVTLHKSTGKWQASIASDKKRVHLGLHSDINAAIMTRWLAERAYGFHSNHGKVL